MVPLDQGRFFLDVTQDSVRKAVRFITWTGAWLPGLFLNCLEEFVLVDLAVQLPEHLLALIVTQLRRTIARRFIELIVFIWRSRSVLLLEVDLFFHEDSRAGRLKIWTSFRISWQVEKIDL